MLLRYSESQQYIQAFSFETGLADKRPVYGPPI